MKDTYRNPFSGVNAAQLPEELILEYWCNPFMYNLFSEIKEEDIYNDTNNIVFMGGRSTGKSMFLRYWSYQVQQKKAEIEHITLNQIIQQNSGVGFYFRIDGAKLKSFKGYDLSEEHWTSLFTHYFELLIGREYIAFLSVLEREGSLDDELIQHLAARICVLLDFENYETLLDILSEFDRRIKEVDLYLGNVPFYKMEFKPKDRGFLSQSISFELAELITSFIPHLSNLNFIILLDEYENFIDFQQKVINTLLRFTKHNIKFRIGMRLEGFRSFEMISEDDFIKEGREYRKVVFEEVLNKATGYSEFLQEISKKRLESVGVLKDRGFTNIKDILGDTENLEIEAKELSMNNPNKVMDFFKKKLPASDIEKIRYKENPLLELMNCIWLSRGVTPEQVVKSMTDYLNKTKNSVDGEKYRRDYVDKYKLSLMFLLCSIYRKNKRYYSFNTFTFLSSGIVGHFLELCRRSFAIAGWSDNEKLLMEGKIDKEFQHKAAIDFSTSEKHQIGRIETYGSAIARFVENIGNIFRHFHSDFHLRYPETNQFAISIDSIQDRELQNAFRAAIRWTIIQRKPKMQRSGPSEHLQDIYTINRIFSPSFQISYRTRGGKSVSLTEDKLRRLMNNTVSSYTDYLAVVDAESVTNKGNQQTLF